LDHRYQSSITSRIVRLLSLFLKYLVKSMSIPRDVQEFLDGYPGVDDDPTYRANFEFYSNSARCIPDSRTIEEIHERLPAYIQPVMWSLIICSVDGLVIMTDWNTSMDIYNGCGCILFWRIRYFSIPSVILGSPLENMG